MKLIEYVNQVFEKDGVLERLGGRSVAEQYQYATSVALSIMERSDGSGEEPRLSLLQADTGVGKTFGYMIPIMIHMAINPELHDKKYVISTYTRQLQKQILSEDVPFIRKVLKELGLDSNQSVCLRMGRQSFFSASRVRGICEKLVKINPERRDELKNFINTVDDICTYGSGLWADYIEEYGDLPNGITNQDICLLNHQKNDDEAYKLHLEQASLSNIIITNHHSILMPKLTGLSNFDVDAIIVDEAHKISPICQELFNYSIGVNELTNLLTKISTKSQSTSSQIGEALATLSTIEVSLKKHPKFESLDYINHLNASEIYEAQKTNVGILFNHLKLIKSKYSKTLDINNLELKEAELLSKLDSVTLGIENWLNLKESQFQVSAFGISKKLKRLSLATINIRGSYLFGSIIKQITNNVVLTSATLANAQKNLSFTQTQNHLGLRKFTVVEQKNISASKYADMRFILTDKSIPTPIQSFEDDEVVFSQKWLSNTCKMINKAMEEDESVLVLTVSHSESKLIAAQLKNSAKVSLHEKGHNIKEYIGDFIQGKTKVLITSSGWEGLNLRTEDKKQLIQHVVISRIPFAPPNTLFEYALEVLSKSHPDLAIYKKNIEWVDAIQEVVAKLKQGFGRGTRSPDDIVTIWIADSRMPHSRSDRNSVLLNAVPNRFLNNYLNAEIFEQQRKEVFFI